MAISEDDLFANFLKSAENPKSKDPYDFAINAAIDLFRDPRIGFEGASQTDSYKSYLTPSEAAVDTAGEAYKAGVDDVVAGMASDAEYFKSIFNTFITGDEEAALNNIEEAQYIEARRNAVDSGIPSLEEFLNEPTFDGAVAKVFGTFGQVAPFAATTLAGAFTGGISALAGIGLHTGSKAALKKIFKDALLRKAKGESIDPELELAMKLGKASLKGQVTRTKSLADIIKNNKRLIGGGLAAGAFSASYPFGAGTSLGEFEDAGIELSKDKKMIAALLGIPIAALDVLGEGLALRLLYNVAKKEVAKNPSSNRLKRFLSDITSTAVKGGLIEAPIETMQEGINIAQRMYYDDKYTAREAWLRAGEAAFGGFIGGAGMGTIGGAASNVVREARHMLYKAADSEIAAEIDGTSQGTDDSNIINRINAPEPLSHIYAQMDAVANGVSTKQGMWIPEGNKIPNEVKDLTPGEIQEIKYSGKTLYAGKIAPFNEATVASNVAKEAGIEGTAEGENGIFISSSRDIVDSILKYPTETMIGKGLGYIGEGRPDNTGLVLRAADGNDKVIYEQLIDAKDADVAKSNAVSQLKHIPESSQKIGIMGVKEALALRKAALDNENIAEETARAGQRRKEAEDFVNFTQKNFNKDSVEKGFPSFTSINANSKGEDIFKYLTGLADFLKSRRSKKFEKQDAARLKDKGLAIHKILTESGGFLDRDPSQFTPDSIREVLELAKETYNKSEDGTARPWGAGDFVIASLLPEFLKSQFRTKKSEGKVTGKQKLETRRKTYKDGSFYVGQFNKDGKFHGQGTYTYPDGATYVGEFKDGNYYGQGTFTFSDGATYVGEFKDDKKHGQGTYTFADGKVKEGLWKNDKFVKEENITKSGPGPGQVDMDFMLTDLATPEEMFMQSLEKVLESDENFNKIKGLPDAIKNIVEALDEEKIELQGIQNFIETELKPTPQFNQAIENVLKLAYEDYQANINQDFAFQEGQEVDEMDPDFGVETTADQPEIVAPDINITATTPQPDPLTDSYALTDRESFADSNNPETIKNNKNFDKDFKEVLSITFDEFFNSIINNETTLKSLEALPVPEKLAYAKKYYPQFVPEIQLILNSLMEKENLFSNSLVTRYLTLLKANKEKGFPVSYSIAIDFDYKDSEKKNKRYEEKRAIVQKTERDPVYGDRSVSVDRNTKKEKSVSADESISILVQRLIDQNDIWRYENKRKKGRNYADKSILILRGPEIDNSLRAHTGNNKITLPAAKKITMGSLIDIGIAINVAQDFSVKADTLPINTSRRLGLNTALSYLYDRGYSIDMDVLGPNILPSIVSKKLDAVDIIVDKFKGPKGRFSNLPIQEKNNNFFVTLPDEKKTNIILAKNGKQAFDDNDVILRPSSGKGSIDFFEILGHLQNRIQNKKDKLSFLRVKANIVKKTSQKGDTYYTTEYIDSISGHKVQEVHGKAKGVEQGKLYLATGAPMPAINYKTKVHKGTFLKNIELLKDSSDPKLQNINKILETSLIFEPKAKNLKNPFKLADLFFTQEPSEIEGIDPVLHDQLRINSIAIRYYNLSLEKYNILEPDEPKKWYRFFMDFYVANNRYSGFHNDLLNTGVSETEVASIHSMIRNVHFDLFREKYGENIDLKTTTSMMEKGKKIKVETPEIIFSTQQELFPQTTIPEQLNKTFGEGFDRVMVGDHGVYVEFNKKSKIFKDKKLTKITKDEDVKPYTQYYEWRDEKDIKYYEQIKPVNYADYQEGKWYVNFYDWKEDSIPDLPEMAEPVDKALSALEKNDKAVSEVMKELDLFIPSQDFETIVDETTMQNILQQWRRFTTEKRRDSEEIFDPSDFDRENFSEEQRDDLIKGQDGDRLYNPWFSQEATFNENGDVIFPRDINKAQKEINKITKSINSSRTSRHYTRWGLDPDSSAPFINVHMDNISNTFKTFIRNAANALQLKTNVHIFSLSDLKKDPDRFTFFLQDTYAHFSEVRSKKIKTLELELGALNQKQKNVNGAIYLFNRESNLISDEEAFEINPILKRMLNEEFFYSIENTLDNELFNIDKNFKKEIKELRKKYPKFMEAEKEIPYASLPDQRNYMNEMRVLEKNKAEQEESARTKYIKNKVVKLFQNKEKNRSLLKKEKRQISNEISNIENSIQMLLDEPFTLAEQKKYSPYARAVFAETVGTSDVDTTIKAKNILKGIIEELDINNGSIDDDGNRGPEINGVHIPQETSSIIILRDSKDEGKMAGVLAHELGHPFFREAFDFIKNHPRKQFAWHSYRKRVYKNPGTIKLVNGKPQYNAPVNEDGSQQEYEFRDDVPSQYFETQRNDAGVEERRLSAKGFEEFIADQIGAYVIDENKKAADIADNMFKALAKKLLNLLKALLRNPVFKKRFTPDEEIQTIVKEIIEDRRRTIETTRKYFNEFNAPGDSQAMEFSLIKDKSRELAPSVISYFTNLAKRTMKSGPFRWGYRYALASDNWYRSLGPSGVKLAQFFQALSQSKEAAGFHHVAGNKYRRYVNKIEDIVGMRLQDGKEWNENEDVDLAFFQAQEETIDTETLPEMPKKLRKLLEEYYDKEVDPVENIDTRGRKNYFPRQLDMNKFNDPTPTEDGKSTVAAETRETLYSILTSMNPRTNTNPLTPKEANMFMEQFLENPHQVMGEVSDIRERVRSKALDGVSTTVLNKAGLLVEPQQALLSYFHHMTRRVELEKRGGSEYLNELIVNIVDEKFGPEKNPDDSIRIPEYLIDAETGEVNNEGFNRYINQRRKFKAALQDSVNKQFGRVEPLGSWMRQFNSVSAVVTVYTTLLFTVLASLPDLGAVILRQKTWGNFMSSLQHMRATMTYAERMDFARAIGEATFDGLDVAFMAVGELDYANTWARTAMRGWFKYTLLSSWTRFTRVFASSMGRSYILNIAKVLNDSNTSAEQRAQYERWLGEFDNLTLEDINTWNSNPDNSSKDQGYGFDTPEGEKVRAAISKFVSESIIRPNPAQRPDWANNPYFSVLFALKQFFYSYGKVVVGGAGREIYNRYSVDGDFAGGPALMLLAMGTMLPLAALGVELRELSKYLLQLGLGPVIPDSLGVREASGRTFRSDYLPWSTYSFEIFEKTGMLGPLSIGLMAANSNRWGDNPIIGSIPAADAVWDAFGKGDWVRLAPILNNIK